MLPKSARLFVLAAVLAAANARGAEGSASSESSGSGPCKGGRISNTRDARAFVGCRRIAGDLSIERSDLPDLTILSELRSVSGALTIRENASLRSLDGLQQLERVGSLTLEENGLYGTRGIEGLHQVDQLVISRNRFLISLRGFRGLLRVGTLVLHGNPRVCAKLGFFSGLTRVERVSLRSNFGLSRDDVAGLLARTRGGAP